MRLREFARNWYQMKQNFQRDYHLYRANIDLGNRLWYVKGSDKTTVVLLLISPISLHSVAEVYEIICIG